MRGTTGFSILLAAALAPVSAQAADEDTQLWSSVIVAAPVGKVNAQWENSWRLREGTDQWLTRASFDSAVAKGLTLGAGFAYVHDAAGGDIRPHQQLTYATGHLSFRTRLEEQFFPAPRATQFRLRQRALYAVPIDAGDKINLTAEALYIVRRGTGGSARRDQWRAGASLVHKLVPKLEGSIGYLAIYAPRTGGPDKLSHAAQIGLTFRP
ncbi:MAG: hypothetical protein RLZZ08_2101 [Pseudomonadota bacterium]|jgi:hypothetical protein